MLDEHIPGGEIPGGSPLQAVSLLLWPQGPGEGAPAGEAQGQKQAVGKEQQRGRKHGIPPFPAPYAPKTSPYAP